MTVDPLNCVTSVLDGGECESLVHRAFLVLAVVTENNAAFSTEASLFPRCFALSSSPDGET